MGKQKTISRFFAFPLKILTVEITKLLGKFLRMPLPEIWKLEMILPTTRSYSYGRTQLAKPISSFFIFLEKIQSQGILKVYWKLKKNNFFDQITNVWRFLKFWTRVRHCRARIISFEWLSCRVIFYWRKEFHWLSKQISMHSTIEVPSDWKCLRYILHQGF